MTQEEMNVLVVEKLENIEKDYQIEILWAVESGSRAWGFASPDSDFDVRFIYKRRLKDYLKLHKDRDVIEIPVDEIWDVNGWDLDKTLKLLQKSNPTLYEWLNSPVVYKKTDFKKNIAPLMKEYFDDKKMIYHYLNIAKNAIRYHLKKDKKVKVKKYFYIIRPILACKWILTYKSAPPVLFDDLLFLLPDHIKKIIDQLLDIKMNHIEKHPIEQNKELNSFIEEEISNIEEHLKNISYTKHSDVTLLDQFFYDQIKK